MSDFTEDEIQIGQQVLQSDDLKIKLSHRGEQFVLRYPNPGLVGLIQNDVARRLGGHARGSFTAEYLAKLEAFTTIDFLYAPEECPEWFSGGPFACLDDELVMELYRGYLQFCQKFRDKLRKGGFKKVSKDKRA